MKHLPTFLLIITLALAQEVVDFGGGVMLAHVNDPDKIVFELTVRTHHTHTPPSLTHTHSQAPYLAGHYYAIAFHNNAATHQNSDTIYFTSADDANVVVGDAILGTARATCLQDPDGLCDDTEKGGSNNVGLIQGVIQDDILRVEFERIRSTGDASDVDLKGDLSVVYAYGETLAGAPQIHIRYVTRSANFGGDDLVAGGNRLAAAAGWFFFVTMMAMLVAHI